MSGILKSGFVQHARRWSKNVVIATLLSLPLLCGTAHAATVVDINTSPEPGFGFNGGSSFLEFEQNYVANTKGTLVGIDFFYVRPAIDTSPMGQGATPESVLLAVGLGQSWTAFNQMANFVVLLPATDTPSFVHIDVKSAGINLDVGTGFVVGWQGMGSRFDSYPLVLGFSTPIDNGIRDRNLFSGYTGQTALAPALRTYVETSPSPVPEPETYAMMIAGLGLLGCVARRRKQN